MFNEAIKLEYIKVKNERTNLQKNYLENLFKKSTMIEEQKNKDLCNFNVDDIIDFYKLNNFKSYDTLVVVNSHCRLYTDYCMKKGMVEDYQNHYMEITKEQLKSCLNMVSFTNRIISKNDLVNMTNQLDNACDKFILQCLYEGICGSSYSDIFLFKMSSIDKEKHEAKLFSGRKVKVSARLIAYAEESNNTYEYFINGTETKKAKQNTLVETGYVLKRTKNQFDFSGLEDITNDAYMAMSRARVGRLFKQLGYLHIISSNAVIESGIINYINEYATENKISGKDALYDKKCLDAIYLQFGKNIVRTSFLSKYESLLVE